MRQKSPLTRLQWERRVRWEYRRPFIWAGVWVVVAACIMAGSMLYSDWLKYREWGGVVLQQSDATCVSTEHLVSRGQPGWNNVFRFGNKGLTSLDKDGCIVGRHYLLSYRIGRTGRLQVAKGDLL